MVYLADGVDAGGCSERRPKVFPDVLGGIDTKTINVVAFHQSFYPVNVRLENPRVLGIDVRQSKRVVTQPTLFDVRLVVIVSD